MTNGEWSVAEIVRQCEGYDVSDRTCAIRDFMILKSRQRDPVINEAWPLSVISAVMSLIIVLFIRIHNKFYLVCCRITTASNQTSILL